MLGHIAVWNTQAILRSYCRMEYPGCISYESCRVVTGDKWRAPDTDAYDWWTPLLALWFLESKFLLEKFVIINYLTLSVFTRDLFISSRFCFFTHFLSGQLVRSHYLQTRVNYAMLWFMIIVAIVYQIYIRSNRERGFLTGSQAVNHHIAI